MESDSCGGTRVEKVQCPMTGRKTWGEGMGGVRESPEIVDRAAIGNEGQQLDSRRKGSP